MDIEYRFLPFAELSGRDVYEILALRQAIFGVEQNCVYQDADGLDFAAQHLLARSRGELVGYARILAAGVRLPAITIGRVVVRMDHRGLGLGRALMQEALTRIESLHGRTKVMLSAQARLEAFYGSLGFASTGNRYEEDGILHVDMARP